MTSDLVKLMETISMLQSEPTPEPIIESIESTVHPLLQAMQELREEGIVDEYVNKDTVTPGFKKEKWIMGGKYKLVATARDRKNDKDAEGLIIKVIDPEDTSAFRPGEVGSVRLIVKGDGSYDDRALSASLLGVDDDHQRKGLASAMYQFARELGNSIIPSNAQTDMGKAFWQGGAGISKDFPEELPPEPEAKQEPAEPEVKKPFWKRLFKEDELEEEIAYHGTTDDIAEFYPLTHFGTEKAAKDRMEYKKIKDGKIYKVDLNIKNPLTIKDFPGIHYDRLYAFELKNKKLISQEEMEAITTIDDKAELRNALLTKLKELGIDGFVYKNKYEDKGNISYVIVDPSQVKVLSVEPAAEELEEYNIRKTKKFIQRAHDQEQGQMYGDMPYSSHPKQVANLGKKFFGPKFNDEAVKVALLHDVLEDTPYTPEQLAKKGFSKEVIQAVQLLTKNKALSYADNIRNIINSGNPLAMMVKYSDNYMNYSGDKSHWDADRAAHSQKKYLASLNMLGDVLGIKKHVGEEPVTEASPNTLEGSFTPDLVESKTWLAEMLAKGLKGKNAGTIYVLGSWYGNMGIFLQQAGVKFDKLVLVEPDEEALMRSKDLLQQIGDEGKLILIHQKAEDVVYEKPGVVINTSCNETGPVFLTKLPDNMLCLLQARNNNENTLFPTEDEEDFIDYFPLEKVYYTGKKQLEDPEVNYVRYMKIGRTGKKLDEEFHTGGSLGLPFPGTYEQEYDMFKSKGPRRITAMTNEALDSSYEYLPGKLPGIFYFDTEDGQEYKVEIDNVDNDATVAFSARGQGDEHKTGITGTGNSRKIFGTVIKIVKDYIRKANPEIISFSANNSEPSRVRLYKMLASQANKELPNYKFTDAFSNGGLTTYYLTRDGVKIPTATKVKAKAGKALDAVFEEEL